VDGIHLDGNKNQWRDIKKAVTKEQISQEEGLSFPFILHTSVLFNEAANF